MKTIILLLLSITLSAQDGRLLHEYAGTVISIGTGALIYKKTQKTWMALTGGFIAGSLVGIAKESIWDKRMDMGTCSNRDAYNTIWGAAVGSLCLSVAINIHRTKKQTVWHCRNY